MAGEELTVNYNYSLAIAPQWYKDCFSAFYKDRKLPTAKIY